MVFMFGLSGCSSPTNEVVVYTSVDQIFSEPVLAAFEKESGIKVRAVYDAEASKTVGLEKRLVAERSKPQADVFWNSEHIRTLKLAEQDLFSAYVPKESGSIPNDFKDNESMLWTGFGVRGRVFVVNSNLIDKADYPQSLEDLVDPKWAGKTAIARPLFGTTSTHFTAFYTRDQVGFEMFIEQLLSAKVAILTGNSHVRDAVVRGEYVFGLTDTDDVAVAIQKGDPVDMVFPDQDREGTFAVFQTVGLIKNAPNSENAKKLIDYLTSEKNEAALVKSGAVQLSVRKNQSTVRIWTEASRKMVDNIEPLGERLRKLF
jgi:iron(III) transport system substrate-binding protein